MVQRQHAVPDDQWRLVCHLDRAQHSDPRQRRRLRSLSFRPADNDRLPEAIFLSCFVLVSQNRQAEKDRVRADIEYEVNIKAELEIAHLHEKTDRLYENMMARFEKLEKNSAIVNR